VGDADVPATRPEDGPAPEHGVAQPSGGWTRSRAPEAIYHGASGEIQRHQLSSWRILLRSFAQLSIGEIIARLIGFAALVAMTRRLGPVSFGLVTLGITLVLWLKLIVDSGTEILNVREISREPDRFKEIAGAVLSLRLCLSGLAIAVFIPIPLLFVEQPRSRLTLWLFALALPAIALNLRFMVLGLRAAKGVAVGNIAGQVLFAAGVLILVAGPERTFVVPLLFAAGELVYGVIVVAFVARRFGLPLPRIDVPAWRATLRNGLPLMVNQLSRALVHSFDVFLIAVVLGSFSTGVYGVAYKPVLFIATLMALLMGSFLASYSTASPTQARELFYKVTRLAVASSLMLAIALNIGAGSLISLAFGSDYRSGATALSILAWFVPLAVLGSAYGTALIANNRQALLMRHNIAAALFNIGANAVVIPLAGISGAAAVTVLSHALVTFLNYRSCIRLGLAPSAGEMLTRTVSGGRTRETVAQPPEP
jgi:O-antigen/teichoic acid export membrane protein